MVTRARKVRSGPVYVETEGGIISLVFDGVLHDGADASPRWVGKPDVYVIDGDGVRLVRRGNRLLRAIVVGLVAYIVLEAVQRILGRALG